MVRSASPGECSSHKCNQTEPLRIGCSVTAPGNLAPTGSRKTFRDFQLQSAAIEIWCTTGGPRRVGSDVDRRAALPRPARRVRQRLWTDLRGLALADRRLVHPHVSPCTRQAALAMRTSAHPRSPGLRSFTSAPLLECDTSTCAVRARPAARVRRRHHGAPPRKTSSGWHRAVRPRRSSFSHGPPGRSISVAESAATDKCPRGSSSAPLLVAGAIKPHPLTRRRAGAVNSAVVVLRGLAIPSGLHGASARQRATSTSGLPSRYASSIRTKSFMDPSTRRSLVPVTMQWPMAASSETILCWSIPSTLSTLPTASVRRGINVLEGAIGKSTGSKVTLLTASTKCCR